MDAIVELKLSYGNGNIAQISKLFELPNVFGDEGIESTIKLTDKVCIQENLNISGLNLDTKVVTVQTIFSVDIKDQVEKKAINSFIEDLKNESWNVKINQNAIDKVNEPPKSKNVIKNEVIIKNEKPTIISLVFTYLAMISSYTGYTYYFNSEKFTVAYLLPSFILFLIVTSGIHYFSLRKYKKAQKIVGGTVLKQNS